MHYYNSVGTVPCQDDMILLKDIYELYNMTFVACYCI